MDFAITDYELFSTPFMINPFPSIIFDIAPPNSQAAIVAEDASLSISFDDTI